MAESEELTAKSEIDQLIECISAFLQQVIKNSYENSLYVVQWYFLFKQILLEGRLTDTLRLDLLLMQLFQ
jgi:inositol 1,4,5-triphosphate receptor type 3